MPKTNGKIKAVDDDTIFAWATPPGKSGVAVLRLSGPHLSDVAAHLGFALPPPRRATLVTLTNPAHNETIDRALCLYFPAPHSFTGEAVVELHTHGSRAIIHTLTAVLSACNFCRLAEPGEFTRRAFDHNKLDLYEVEGLADLIDADTPHQHRQAMRQFRGDYSHQMESWREGILHAMAWIEAYIDFPDEDIPDSVLFELNEKISSFSKTINNQLNNNNIGEKIRDGFRVVIFGPPNAGKSSLLNLLAQRDVAIVSTIPGTTRDSLEVHMEIRGHAVTLIDTAGLRESSDSIEQQGIARAEHLIRQADIKIALFDASTDLTSVSEIDKFIDNHTIIVMNKSDLVEKGRPASSRKHALYLSTVTHEGVEALIERVGQQIESLTPALESVLITRHRHRLHLAAALQHLHAAEESIALELRAEELRRAAHEIAKITGRIDVDNVLDIIFRSFCIGK